MNAETNSEPVDYEARSKTLEEDNEKLKLALTEVNGVSYENVIFINFILTTF